MKEQVLRIIREASQYTGSVTHDSRDFTAGWEVACEHIEESVEKLVGWISVEDRLPPPEDVDSYDSDFVLCDDGRPFVDRYSYFIEGRMPVRVTGWESGRNPTHWQPLPSPPQKPTK